MNVSSRRVINSSEAMSLVPLLMNCDRIAALLHQTVGDLTASGIGYCQS